MFKAYVSQVKTLKTTGDVTGAIEIACAENKELKQEVMAVDHETIVVLTLVEFDTYMNIIQELELAEVKEDKEKPVDFGAEDGD